MNEINLFLPGEVKAALFFSDTTVVNPLSGIFEMSAKFSFEKTCTKIASMKKREVIRQLLNFDGPLKMDYTCDYLEKQSTDRLRHILLAAFVTVNRKHAS